MTQDPDRNLDLELQLEQRVDRALKQLRHPAAPASFAARVMRRIDVADVADEPNGNVTPARVPASPEWPLAWKIALTGMGFVLVVSALLLWPLALEFASTSWQSPVVVFLRAAVAAARPLVPIALVYVTAMCAVSAAAVSMLKHVALGGATNQ